MGKSAGSAPAAPDPTVVANAQSNANIEAARATAALNRVNTTTPFGSLTYTNNGQQSLNDLLTKRYSDYQAGTYRPDYGNDEFGAPIQEGWRGDIEEKNARAELGTQADQWSATSTLSPQAQALVDQLYRDSGADGGRKSVEDALFARLNPSLDQQRTGLETRLRNQGLMPGSEAWDAGMRAQGMAENDARLAVTAQAGNEQSRAIQALLSLSGATPAAGGGGGGGGGGGANVQAADWQSAYGNQQAADQAAYQGRVANASSGNAAAAGIAAAAITAAAAIA